MSNRFRRQVLTGFAIILGGIVAIGAGLYLLSSMIDAESASVAFYKTSIATKSSALESLADLKNNSAAAKEYETAVGKILVSRDQLITFPDWINKLAHARQVSVSFSFQGSQVSPTESAPGYIGFGVNAAGSLGDLTDFFKDVEYRQPQFLTSLDSFDINRSDSGYSVAASGRVFFK